MAREPDMALLITASGYLAHTRTSVKISSKSTVSITKHAFLKMIHAFSRICC